jgi:sec-independent protein translocase protein TatA
MNFLGMGPMELMMILVLALIVFGPGKLPEIAGQVGRVVRDFRRTTSELSSEFSRTLSLEVEERKSTRAPAAATEAAYEPPPAETVVGNVDAATAGTEPAEAPPIVVTTTSSSPPLEECAQGPRSRATTRLGAGVQYLSRRPDRRGSSRRTHAASGVPRRAS